VKARPPYAVRVCRRGSRKEATYIRMDTLESAREVAKRLNESAPKTVLFYAARLSFRERHP
jgi:hypothetical protein